LEIILQFWEAGNRASNKPGGRYWASFRSAKHWPFPQPSTPALQQPNIKLWARGPTPLERPALAQHQSDGSLANEAESLQKRHYLFDPREMNRMTKPQLGRSDPA